MKLRVKPFPLISLCYFYGNTIIVLTVTNIEHSNIRSILVIFNNQTSFPYFLMESYVIVLTDNSYKYTNSHA